MDTERTEAIVLRLHPVTESSLIITWFTRECGKLKTMAKGARRAKSPFRGKLDLFYRAEILFLPSRRSDLHLLHDCFLEDPHRKLRDSVGSLAAASYVSELVDLATESEDPNPKLFDLLVRTLDALETEKRRPALLIWFELHLLAVIGWAPKWESTAAITRVLNSLAVTSIDGARRVRLTENQIGDARQVVWAFLDEQLGRVPRSRRMFMETLSR